MKKRRHKKHTAGAGERATIDRSFVITLGLAFCTVSVAAWIQHRDRGEPLIWWQVCLLIALMLMGIVQLVIGFWASPGCIKKWACLSSHHWAGIFIWILAYPVHLLLGMFDRRR